ncbi:inositol monophosphatase family protein [Deinococcus aquiradiocola]|uniref:Inositol-1-monophosphatase n=1 Tax=Deinococcus aquiradiocola TaxID=393059 RepID=A0A917URY0_9DEIO|nr:inositol monophosphatase family protein [Deinococcus aquiradiocola]GGJ80963.1 inositol monophosphatase [Deinococcus aquiradiocola]
MTSLPDLDLEAALHLAIRAAHEAGRIQQAHVGRAHTIRTKSSFSDLVTEVDGLCEAAIRAWIAREYPDHAVLGEEEGEQGSAAAEYRWVVDPLDGTVNYAHGFPFYCVSIALERRSQDADAAERLLGVVYDATRDELFTAVAGRGAHLNGAPVRVSGTPTLTTPALLSTGFPYDPGDHRNLRLLGQLLALGVPVRRPGAAALDLCYVACGRLDGYWEMGLKPWDSAAGSLIVTEAGGQVTDALGVARADGPVIVASNGALHDELLGVLDAGAVP